MTNNWHYLDPNPSGHPVVLLLHGLGANGSSWTLQFDALREAGFRPISPDMPGFGDSKYDGKGWSVKRIADDLAGLINDLGCGQVHVVGLSLGGVVAQQLTLDHPEIVRKLVLVSTFPVLRPSNLIQWYYFFRRLVVVHTLGLTIQSKIVAKHVFPRSDQEVLRNITENQIASADPRAYRAAMRELGFFNSRSRLKLISAPTLVVSGTNDTTVSPERQKELAEGIPGAKLVSIEGGGHVVAVDQFEAFNLALLKHLTD